PSGLLDVPVGSRLGGSAPLAPRLGGLAAPGRCSLGGHHRALGAFHRARSDSCPASDWTTSRTTSPGPLVAENLPLFRLRSTSSWTVPGRCRSRRSIPEAGPCRTSR